MLMNNFIPDPLAPEEVRFRSGDVRCAGSFYRPRGSGPFPVIVMAHGLGGTRNMRLPAYAERFVAGGYACLIFDYRHFGGSEGEPRQLISIRRQLEDWKAAVAHARGVADVDPARVILWGTSFSGGHVLSIAADDQQLAAVVAQGLFTHGLASTLAMPPLITAKITVLALLDCIGALFGVDPLQVAIAGRPGETALMTAPDAYHGYLNLAPLGVTIKNFAPARFALDIVRYFPGRKTSKIQAPVLFCVCNTDSVAPAGPTLRYAERTPHKEIMRYDEGHFDIYLGEAFERVIGDQLDFLRRAVPAVR